MCIGFSDYCGVFCVCHTHLNTYERPLNSSYGFSFAIRKTFQTSSDSALKPQREVTGPFQGDMRYSTWGTHPLEVALT